MQAADIHPEAATLPAAEVGGHPLVLLRVHLPAAFRPVVPAVRPVVPAAPAVLLVVGARLLELRPEAGTLPEVAIPEAVSLPAEVIPVVLLVVGALLLEPLPAEVIPVAVIPVAVIPVDTALLERLPVAAIPAAVIPVDTALLERLPVAAIPAAVIRADTALLARLPAAAIPAAAIRADTVLPEHLVVVIPGGTVLLAPHPVAATLVVPRGARPDLAGVYPRVARVSLPVPSVEVSCLPVEAPVDRSNRPAECTAARPAWAQRARGPRPRPSLSAGTRC